MEKDVEKSIGYMRWLVLAGHVALVLLPIIGLIYWYEVQRAYYCYPTALAKCGSFSFALPQWLLFEAYAILLFVVAVPQLAALFGKAGKADSGPKGHAVYLMKAVPTGLFTGVVLAITGGRAGANDVEWISLAVTGLVLILGVRGLLSFYKGWELRSGAGWLFAVIGLLILAMMAALTLFALQNMDRMF